jgi:uncharacterized phiE125 gp8 family phage protein
MADARDLTTLANAKGWLNIPSAQTSEDALLTRLVTAASLFFLQAIDRVNLNQASYVEKRNGNGSTVLLVKNYPIISVQSLSIDGAPVPASPDGVQSGFVFDDYSISLVGGGTGSGESGAISAFTFNKGYGNVAISYTAGYAQLPPEVEQAVIELIAFRYRERGRIGLVSEQTGSQVSAYSQAEVPASVKRVIAQYTRRVPSR